MVDGSNTMHVMGGIQCLSPQSNILPPKPVPKVNVHPTKEEIASMGEVPIHTFHRPVEKGLSSLTLKNWSELMPFSQHQGELPSLALTYCGFMGGRLNIQSQNGTILWEP